MLTMLFIFSLGLFPDNGNTIYRVICAPVISGSNHLPIGPDGRAPPHLQGRSSVGQATNGGGWGGTG